MEPSLERYSRQMRFHGIGESGQICLRDAHVTLCGCGALGTVLANILARAGVGRANQGAGRRVAHSPGRTQSPRKPVRKASAGSRSLRATLARPLADRANSLLLMTATPHDGSASSFNGLIEMIEMLNPTAVADPDVRCDGFQRND